MEAVREWLLVGIASVVLAITILGVRAFFRGLRRRRETLEVFRMIAECKAGLAEAYQELEEVREAKSRRLDAEAARVAIAAHQARQVGGRP